MAEQLPLACSLSAGELADRRGVWQRLAAEWLHSRRQTSTGVELSYRADDGVEAKLRDLAALEADCCSFADWAVSRSGDRVMLEVTAPPDAVPAVHALFASPA
ncbi:MAG: hypothetical protein H0U32_10845 [Thermoleophilaceae bacterium]|nr:hypothetical protein [Thermoleophilaceae bacterium]